jgi:hypothetical protein
MQLNCRQAKDKTPKSKETITTNTETSTKKTQT